MCPLADLDQPFVRAAREFVEDGLRAVPQEGPLVVRNPDAPRMSLREPHLTLTGPRPERASAPHPDFTTIRASPKDRLTLPLAGWKCGKPTNPWQPLAGL